MECGALVVQELFKYLLFLPLPPPSLYLLNLNTGIKGETMFGSTLWGAGRVVVVVIVDKKGKILNRKGGRKGVFREEMEDERSRG